MSISIFTMRRRWAQCAGRNEHRLTPMGFLSPWKIVSSILSRTTNTKNIYSICSSQFSLELTFFKFIQKSIIVLSLFIITLTTSCSDPFPKGHLFDLMILQKLLPKPTTATTTPTPVSTPTPIVLNYIFVTTTGRNGNLGGITGADSICQTEKTTNFPTLPGNATDYKALLVSGTTRRACSTADCSGGVSENVDWVLKANTDYYRLDGTTDTKIFTTNASGIVNFTGGATLLAAIDSSGATIWWTGLFNDWTTNFACTGNNWGNTTGQGGRGIGNSTSSTSIDIGTTNGCASSYRLICVRQ